MKKLINIFAFCFIALSFTACEEDDEFTFIASPAPTADFTFTNSVSENYNLSPLVADNPAERFVWNEADFDVQTPISYKLQSSTTETGSFKEISGTGSITETNQAITIGSMLDLATEAGLDNDPETEAPNEGTLYFRVRAYVGSDGGNVVEQFSNVLSLNVSLIESTEEPEEPELPKMYVTGNFVAAGMYGADWTPADGVAIASTGEGDNNYEGFISMDVAAPEYKFLPSNEGWDGDYGDADTSGNVPAYSQVLLQDDEVNCTTPDGSGGYYWVKANPEDLTYSLTKTSWGVIGNATPTGWDADTDMTYDPATKTWSVTLDLTQQEPTDNGFKFRANDAWDINLGDTGADGNLSFGGDNIGVPEDGNYTITLDLSNPRNYTYTLTQN